MHLKTYLTSLRLLLVQLFILCGLGLWGQPVSDPVHMQTAGTYNTIVDTVGLCSTPFFAADTTGNFPAVGDTTFYYWDYGNGQFDTIHFTEVGATNGLIVNGHIFRTVNFFPSVGCFTVQLTVSNDQGTDVSSFVVCYDDPTVNSVYSDVSCFGMNDGFIDLTVTGAGGPIDYLWPHDGSTTEDQTGLGPGNYSVTVTFSGCDTTLSWLIKEPPFVNQPTASGDTTYCVGDLLAPMTATGTGGTYTWYTNAGLTSVHDTGASVWPGGSLGSTTYYLTETIDGCESTADQMTVTINPKPSAPDPGPDLTYCQGQVMQPLSATGTGGTINWYSDVSTTQFLGSGTIFPSGVIGSTTYYVTENISGCNSLPANITITVYPNTDPTILTPPEFCENSPAENLSAADPGGVWSGIGITDSINGTFDPGGVSEGVYIVTHTSGGGCGGVDSVPVIVHQAPTLTAALVDETCPRTADGSIDLTVTDGSTPYSYSWSNGSTDEDQTNLTAGSYTVVVTDSLGCTEQDTYVLPGANTTDCGYHIWVANVFSPDADGMNDILYARGTGIETIEFSVFNKWGQRVFFTTDQTLGWDGTVLGKPANQGVFMYSAVGQYFDGQSFKAGGSVTLVR